MFRVLVLRRRARAAADVRYYNPFLVRGGRRAKSAADDYCAAEDKSAFPPSGKGIRKTPQQLTVIESSFLLSLETFCNFCGL